MPRKARNLLLALVVIYALAVLTVLFLPMGRTAPRPPLPNPNGYDDFVKAGQAVTGSVWNFPELDHDSLGALVATNAQSLRQLRVGLTRRCLMPMDCAVTNAAGNLSQLAGMKTLAQLLAAEGRLREMDNRPGRGA